MHELIKKISECVEKGKINAASPFPPDLKGQDGADELTKQAVAEKIAPEEILEGCMEGMQNIGEKFSKNLAFVPEMLMSAKAMTAVMDQLKPFFDSGEVKAKGLFVTGTVAGDLHDIGKNLVSMVVKGGGWEIVDLGVDVSPEKFVEAAMGKTNCVVGLSALLTTTMGNMEKTVQLLKDKNFEGKIIIGGAPVTQDFADKIGADAYGDNPQAARDYLNTLAV
ncbi:MAG: cobalamin-dependent protein [Fibrobacteria bacterium]|nr:cobalamin-dependent protein [Fibrobacteria bacterium]